MNYNQVSFDKSKSFHVTHVTDEYNVGNIRPVIHSSEDVQRMVEESSRARLISQIVAAPEDYMARDFAASFQSATRDIDPPQFATSHKARPEPKRHMTIPTYPMVQSLRWNPYVEMSSAENSRTNLAEEKTKFNCRCESCSVKNCPSRVFSSTTPKPVSFKDNIMTFSDVWTMTPRLNDACCGVCTSIPMIPKVSDACVPPDVAVRDTETVTYFPQNYYTHQECAPIPILKRPDFGQPACLYGYCGLPTGHVPGGIRQEAVRDTDTGEYYCEPVKPKSLKNFFKFKKKHVEQPHCMPEYGRKIIYNEGISDKLANNCPIPPIRVPSPINVVRESSGVSVKSKNRCYIDTEDGIPYAHRGESRYHHSCKKPNLRPSYHCSDVEEVRHVVDSPNIIRKTYTSRPTRNNNRAPSISLPRKVLTSEANIESYIDKGRPESNLECPSRRRKKNKK